MTLLDSEKIKVLREKRGWDQYELAEAAKVNPSVISRIERGLQTDFKFSVIVSVAQALGVTIDELLLSSRLPEPSEPAFLSELQEALMLLRKEPGYIQRHAAGIIKGLISSK